VPKIFLLERFLAAGHLSAAGFPRAQALYPRTEGYLITQISPLDKCWLVCHIVTEPLVNPNQQMVPQLRKYAEALTKEGWHCVLVLGTMYQCPYLQIWHTPESTNLLPVPETGRQNA
jgi:hypothetical protein